MSLRLFQIETLLRWRSIRRQQGGICYPAVSCSSLPRGRLICAGGEPAYAPYIPNLALRFAFFLASFFRISSESSFDTERIFARKLFELREWRSRRGF
jgi:hypothetical protein